MHELNYAVAVVTGSSSGIGHETSLTLARNGFVTYATVRNPNKSENIKSLAEKEKIPLKIVMLDKSVKNAIQSITDESSRIDVLVNNAGYVLFGAVEELAMEGIKAQFETNLFGVIRVTQAVLPIMRKHAQVISNLLSNAFKFTKEGSIIINLGRDQRNINATVSVKDSGKGIDPEVVPRLFEKFASKSFQGTGLGLFISRSIVEGHGGRIWAVNNNNVVDGQRGATFYFSLPIIISQPNRHNQGEG